MNDEMKIVYNLGDWYVFENFRIESDGGITPTGRVYKVTDSMTSIIAAQKRQWQREFIKAS